MRRSSVLLTCLVLVAGVVGAPRATAAPASFTFTGQGWGHQVGASQWGMKGQSDEGRSYGTILTHYYAGTAVETRTPPSEIRVRLASGLDELKVSGDGPFAFRAGGSTVANATGSGTWSVRSDSSKRFNVFRPDGTKAAGPVGSGAEPLVIAYEPDGTIVSLPATGHRYRWGHIELDALDGSQIRAIAVLSLERYVRGIGEVPSSWPTEALKAQAVAARTFASEKASRTGGHRSICNCTVFSDTRDQVYVGYDKEDPATFGGNTSTAARWPQAVEATANEVVTSGGSPVQALYHSSSVVRTENNEDVFGGSPFAYLRSQDDHWADTPENPFASWEETLSQSHVASDLGMGVVETIDLSQRTDGGGVATAVVTGDTTKTFTGERFRSRLGLRSIKIDPIGGTGAVEPPPPGAEPPPESDPGSGDLGGFGGFGAFGFPSFGQFMFPSFGSLGFPSFGDGLGSLFSQFGFGSFGASLGALFGGFDPSAFADFQLPQGDLIGESAGSPPPESAS